MDTRHRKAWRAQIRSFAGRRSLAAAILLGLLGALIPDSGTLYGQLGYMQADDEDETDVITDAFWARVVGRYFPTEKSRLQAELLSINGEENDSSADDIDGWGWGLRYDRAIKDGPVSWFASYKGTYIDSDDGDDGDLTDHTAFVGIKLALGARNMKDEDRRGATLDTPAWAMGRWTGWTLGVVD